MGMYTRLIFNAQLENLSETDIAAIQWCISNSGKNTFPFSEKHEFFKHNRADMIFTCDAHKKPSFTKIREGSYHLDSDAEIKNYGGEIELFLVWVKPFIKIGLLDSDCTLYAKTQHEEFHGYCEYYLDRIVDKQTMDDHVW